MVSSPSLIPNLIAAALYIVAAIYQGSSLAKGRKIDKRLPGLLGTIAVIAQGGALFFQLITPLGLSLDFFSAASLIAVAVIALTLLACLRIP
ncbi:inner membrane protein YpjD, partial [Pseudomonas fulva]